MNNLTGRTFAHYTILEQIGHGGMAAVYRATDLTTSRLVALKILSPYLAAEEQFRVRFQREVDILRRLRHPHIMPIEEYGEIRGLAYIVMPYLKDGTLQDRMKKGPLTPREGARLTTQVCSALDFAHQQGVIHRDIKPSNILLNAEGNALLADFGFAHLPDSTSNLTGSLLIGTPAYMSPEQCRGEGIDARSDQYSFGVVLYELTTGRLPYEADTPMGIVVKHASQPLPAPRAVNPNLPEAVEAVLIRALAKDAANRFDSMAALDKAFQSALAESLDRSGMYRPAPGRRPPASRPIQRRSSRRLWVGALAAALVVLLGVPAAAFAIGGPSTVLTWFVGIPPTATERVAAPDMLAGAATNPAAQSPAAGPATLTGALAFGAPSATPTSTRIVIAGSEGSPTVSATWTLESSSTATELPVTSTLQLSSTPQDTHTPVPSATSPPSETATPTASDTPQPTDTPTVSPTPTQDCGMIAVGSTYISLGKIVVMSVRNLNPMTVYLTGSNLDWTDAYHPSQYVDWMQWRGITYYSGDSYDPPTSAAPGSPRAFPNGTTQSWRAGFGGVPPELGLDGTFTVQLTFNGACTVLGSVTRHAPTPTTTPEPSAAPTESPAPTLSETP